MQLSEDGDEIILMHRKSKKKKEYIDKNEDIFNFTEQFKHDLMKYKDHQKSRKERLAKIRIKTRSRGLSFVSQIAGLVQNNDDDEEELCDDDLIDSDDLEMSDKEDCDLFSITRKYDWIQSNSRYKIDDIVGVIVGGMSSRFWMLRKHLNSISVDKYNSE